MSHICISKQLHCLYNEVILAYIIFGCQWMLCGRTILIWLKHHSLVVTDFPVYWFNRCGLRSDPLYHSLYFTRVVELTSAASRYLCWTIYSLPYMGIARMAAFIKYHSSHSLSATHCILPETWYVSWIFTHIEATQYHGNHFICIIRS